MEILSTRPPELNPDDVAKSFQMITEYLFKTMESIDFTLAKNRREISETDTSSSGLAEQISGVRSDIVLLSGAVVSLQNRLNTLTEKVNGIEETVGNISGNISTINSTIEEFERRISALENPTP